jgi:ribosome-associated protein
LINIQEIADFADYFILCSGSSDRMLDALADHVLRKAREIHKLHGRLEGRSHDGWLIIDFGDVVVHIFTPDQRQYYQLEKLWDRGKVLLHVQ